jgi:hypothetical protein
VSVDIKRILFRRGLVVFQFVIAQALIIGTLVVASQMDYFRTADMGFTNRRSMPVFPMIAPAAQKLICCERLYNVPGVENVSFSMFAPSGDDGWYTDLQAR